MTARAIVLDPAAGERSAVALLDRPVGYGNRRCLVLMRAGDAAFRLNDNEVEGLRDALADWLRQVEPDWAERRVCGVRD